MDYQKIITADRRKQSVVSGRNLIEELASDRSRILYSPHFRRLARKKQVFPLESNAAVRNRVMHSLEVSDVGRLIAYYVTTALITAKQLNVDLQLPIMYAVENACLIHDIGNPPFGHFGEAAIRKWFCENWEKCYITSNNYGQIGSDDVIKKLICDFEEFDGNPQGVRIALRLKRDRDEFSYNLTYTTILSKIKYTRAPHEPKGEGLRKKPGYFASEKDIIEGMKGKLVLCNVNS